MDWEVIATTSQLTAELWQDYLQQQGIPVAIQAGDTMSFLGVSPFPCRVMTTKEHAERALELLEELAQSSGLLEELEEDS